MAGVGRILGTLGRALVRAPQVRPQGTAPQGRPQGTMTGIAPGSLGERMLGGIFPGAIGNPPRRQTRDFLLAYSESAWLRALVGRISWDVAAVEWQLYAVKRGGKFVRDPALMRTVKSLDRRARRAAMKTLANKGDLTLIATNPLLDVLDAANPWQTGFQMRQVYQAHLELVGEAFWMKERGKLGQIVAIWPIPPNWIMSTPTPSNRVYRVSWRGWQGEIPDTEILWSQLSDPADPYGRGSGPAQAVADEIETDEYAARHLKGWFFKSARPDIVVSAEGLDPTETARMERDWLQRHQGFWRSFKPYFVGRKIDVKEIGTQDFRQQQMVQLRQHERDVIMQAGWSVPPEIMGVVENSNRATASAARRIYAENCLVPRLEFSRGIYQERLVPEFDERMVIDYVSPVEDDAEFNLEVRKAAPWALTVNEWREAAGVDPVPDGDVYMIPTTMATADTLEPKPPMPAPVIVPPAAIPSSGNEALKPAASARGMAKADHKFSFVAVMLPPEPLAALRAWKAQALAPADVVEDEPDSHITAFYGLHTSDPAEVQAVVAGHGPVTAALGPLAVFAGEGDNPDVLYVSVTSPDLHALHARLGAALANTVTHPAYIPHLTVAYLARGAGARYTQRTPLEGLSLTWRQVAFCAPDEQAAMLTLTDERSRRPRRSVRAGALPPLGLTRAAVDRLADRLSPDLKEAFLTAVETAKGEIDVEALAKALEDGDLSAAEAELTVRSYPSMLLEDVRPVLAQAFSEAGALAAEALSAATGVAVAFDVANPRASQWAATYSGELIQGITDAQRAAVRSMLASAERGEGETVYTLARKFRDMFGLTENQVAAVENFRTRLEGAGVDADKLEGRVGRYTDAQLRARGETIARTEVSFASNQGQLELWRQGVQRGEIDPGRAKKEWLAHEDDRLEPECEALDGKRVPIDEPFIGRVMAPPLHPRCRCNTGLVYG